MTPKQVRSRVNKIRTSARDFEAAHSMEDTLHQDVLWYIATGNPTLEEARELAYEAMRTKTISFKRVSA